MKRFAKNSAERKRVRVDFTDWLDGSETLSAVQFLIAPVGLSITSAAIDSVGGTSYGEVYGPGKSLIGFADGGTSGVTYT
ncbi:hypothetical protein, partial [Phenylobacterium sp.]|uniref:hypothetical protein n=1 Tax=Phenylobacterium sp. TaxID=1871053 RepID=UPI0025DA09B1